MEAAPDTPIEPATLWRVTAFGRQRTPAGRPYWWDNRRRRPAGMVIVQATLEGSIIYRDTRGDRPARPGSLMIFAYDEPTAYGSPQPLTQPYRCQWVNLQGAGLLEHITAFRQRHGSVRDVGLGHSLIAELDALIALAQPRRAAEATTMAAAVHAFILHLFDHAQRHLRQRQTPVEQAIEYMLGRPRGTSSLEQIAARFGCSREYLGRAFRARAGEAPGRYLANLKRQRAIRLLRETDLSLAAVAEQVGFASAHTLARQVRRATGVSPTALREHHGSSAR